MNDESSCCPARAPFVDDAGICQTDDPAAAPAPAPPSETPSPNPSPPTAEDIDRDGDGLSFADEEFYGTSDFFWDSDFDGLTDVEEIFGTATNPAIADTDGDGFSDGEEVLSHTDPNDPNDPPPFVPGNVFSFLTQDETNVMLSTFRVGERAVAREFAFRLAQLMADLAGRGVLGGGAAQAQLCGVGREASEAVIVLFEEVLFGILDDIGYRMTSSDRLEVSEYMHDRFDSDAECAVASCSFVSALCR